MSVTIFLGAGASKADGAPLQKDLFRSYFKKALKNPRNDDMERELATFFLEMFSINVENGNLDQVVFPTFEEVLGIIDLAERRGESLKNYDLENRATNSNRLRMIRIYLVLLMAVVIRDSLRTSNGYHVDLVDKLNKNGLLNEVNFISTNYDILIDNALIGDLWDYHDSIDYGVRFTNFYRENDWREPNETSTNLYKIHGSLNWLMCSTCNTLTYTPLEKGVLRLIDDFENANCDYCQSVLVPLIVPPTFFKELNNHYLQTVWNLTEQKLRNTEHIIFCGYSFPDADIHVKYLLKRIQTNRTKPLKISVFNHFDGKDENIAAEEEFRYKRYLGVNVEFNNVSFEDFSLFPDKYF